MSHQLTLGTFCHENGHMLCDYPDLYDYGSESSGVGAFCLMCAGANINEKNPVHISAYLKRLSGWANSTEPIQHDQQISLPAGGNDFAIFSRDNSEYFIIENRRKSGRDVALPDAGLAIWHVDEGGDNSDEQMTPSQHYELSLEQADGDFKFETSPNQYGDANDLHGQANKRFADATSPNSKWWDGTASNLDIFDISGPGDTVTFRAKLFEDGGDSQTVRRESTPGRSIPDNRAEGITETITIDQDALIAGVKVDLDITHTFSGDLRVTLVAPWGAAIVLHQKGQGGGADDIQVTIDESELQGLATLHGHSTKGDWKLLVQDLAAADVGTLNRWALEFAAAAQSQGEVVLEESPGVHIPDNNPAGIQRNLSTTAGGNVVGVEVSVDITHTFVGDLRISLRSPAGTEVILRDKTGGSADDVIETYTPATTAPLGGMVGEPASGSWQLSVSDRVGQDVGKLNSWRLVIRHAT